MIFCEAESPFDWQQNERISDPEMFTHQLFSADTESLPKLFATLSLLRQI